MQAALLCRLCTQASFVRTRVRARIHARVCFALSVGFAVGRGRPGGAGAGRSAAAVCSRAQMDHGVMGKGLLYETGGRIAMFARYPAHPYFTAGKTVGFHESARACSALARVCGTLHHRCNAHTRRRSGRVCFGDGCPLCAACSSQGPTQEERCAYRHRAQGMCRMHVARGCCTCMHSFSHLASCILRGTLHATRRWMQLAGWCMCLVCMPVGGTDKFRRFEH